MSAADARFVACADWTIGEEGGFSDDPDDPGGATCMGITQATLADWLDRPVSAEDVRGISQALARAIYRARYWNALRGDQLPAGVDLAVFDAAVLCGPARAARWLQNAVGALADGAIGPRTLSALSLAAPALVIPAICQSRLGYLKGRPAAPKYIRGWAARIDRLRLRALKMTGA